MHKRDPVGKVGPKRNKAENQVNDVKELKIMTS